MGGLMMRFIRSFRPGDFMVVNEQFGRVTEIGLMHTEIQTEDRDLITYPNIYFITNPIKVIRSSGTIISATLSLGYDIHHTLVEELLKSAAKTSGLDEGFVRVVELGDFSVTYRVAGFLKDVKLILVVRSDLRKNVLDLLHKNGIEIVSPNFMNTRTITEKVKFIPKKVKVEKTKEKTDDAPEKLIFDKVEEAEALSQLKNEFDEKTKQLQELKKTVKSATVTQKMKIEKEIEIAEKHLDILEKRSTN